MRKLVIDNSNGRTKFALAEGGELCSEVRVLTTREITGKSVSDLLQGWAFQQAFLCTVVPAAAETLTRCLSSLVPVQRVCAGMPGLPVDFSAYPARETLGADRVANAVAGAVMQGGAPFIVIDAGTATTLDIVLPAREGGLPCYQGGSIAPGLGTLAAALHQSTAQLPSIPLELPRTAVGQNTVEAMQSGCVLGYRGLLRELIAEAELECACRFTLLATGGDAPLLVRLLPEIACADPLLTLRGIARCAM